MQEPQPILRDSPNPPLQQQDVPVANPRKISRPRIQLPSLQIPTPAAPMPTIHAASPPQMNSPYGIWLQSPAGHPLTPMGPVPLQGIQTGPTGLPIGLAGNMGRFTFYPSKAGEFMFKQFEGFKDFTMNTAKSGLSHGEKTAFWLHGKVSSWSKRWFTHIFLFLVIFAYSLIGAAIFVTVEGSNELHDYANNTNLVKNTENWTGFARAKLYAFETELRAHIKRGEDDHKPERVWTYWNAVFYCGTIYTTIVKMTVISNYLYNRFKKLRK